MNTDRRGQAVAATMSLSVKDGKLTGIWQSRGRTMEMKDLKL